MQQSHPGRPRAPRKPGYRSTLSLRTTAELFDELDRRAKAKGRPLSQECELLLEYAVRDASKVDAILDLEYGPRLATLLREMAHVMRRTAFFSSFNVVRHRKGGMPDPLLQDENWMTDAYCFDQAAQAAKAILEARTPKGERTPEWMGELRKSGEFPSEDLPNRLGETVANQFLEDVDRRRRPKETK